MKMCAAAENLTASCLEGWDLDWDAAGYEDTDDFQNSCETWAWEQEQLNAAAKKRGMRPRACLRPAQIEINT